MARVDDLTNLVPERIAVGLSAMFGVTVQPFQSVVTVKILSGGSLEIGGSYALNGSGASTAFTWTKGYLIGAAEILSFNSTGTFYLAATGSTVVALVLRGYGPGGDF